MIAMFLIPILQMARKTEPSLDDVSKKLYKIIWRNFIYSTIIVASGLISFTSYAAITIVHGDQVYYHA
ncbi:hypothetical protein, partial [Salmonella sp. SAL4445]|uniref:hypothetical protein n=1 Tax=Salmonella sp. SAL4445 TaxID=3159900 RepID=UPI00397CB132